jgi:hypothetical protein
MMPAITFGSMQEWQYIFCIFLSFWEKSWLNRCGTQRKWNDWNSMDSCKCCNTVNCATSSLSAIEWDDSNRDFSKNAKSLLSRSSRGGRPLRISSCRSWRPRYISAIQNRTVQSW